MDDTHVIILAGGKGNRMQSELPKVLIEVKNKPLIHRVLESVEQSQIPHKPVVVVGYKRELVEEFVGDRAHTVHQAEQLGTGHAVKTARPLLDGKAKSVIVLYGDHPLTSSDMIHNLVEEHSRNGNVITMGLTEVTDFGGWRSALNNFGRIVRDDKGAIVKNVEYKDATDEERAILEVNPCYLCFDAEWLWTKLDELGNNNAQGEYYLTDLVGMARNEGRDLGWVHIEPHEAIGVNSKEQLELVEQYIDSMHN